MRRLGQLIGDLVDGVFTLGAVAWYGFWILLGVANALLLLAAAGYGLYELTRWLF